MPGYRGIEVPAVSPPLPTDRRYIHTTIASSGQLFVERMLSEVPTERKPAVPSKKKKATLRLLSGSHLTSSLARFELVRASMGGLTAPRLPILFHAKLLAFSCFVFHLLSPRPGYDLHNPTTPFSSARYEPPSDS
ncbi:hypothetical protein V2G26_005435 [Clonostachys chloroleuca]